MKMHATVRRQGEATARAEPRAIRDWPQNTSIHRTTA
jgi:hypothetical protein